MAYSIGFVDNTGSEGIAHHQMLLAIKTLAEANGWTTLRYDDVSATRELIMVGEGLSGVEEIYVGFRSYESVAADYYNLSVAGFTGYLSGNSFITQPGYVESGIPAHNNRIDYWLVANAQRIAFGMKVGTPVYESGYVGKFFPFAIPSQYPYPLVVGGMLTGVPATRFSDTTHSMYHKGNRANLKMRFVDGTWKTPKAVPWSERDSGMTNDPMGGLVWTLRDTGDAYSLVPVVLVDDSPNVYGALDGIYHVSGFNNAVENTFSIGGKDYVVLQDVYRTGFNDYYALELS
jgi:hypothetical protein